MLSFTAVLSGRGGSFRGQGWKLNKVKESCERVMVFAFFIAWRYTVITALPLQHVIESECTRPLHRSLFKKMSKMSLKKGQYTEVSMII